MLLRRLRKRLGLTQGEFGELLDVGEAHMSHFECGRRPLNGNHIRILRALERALELHPPEFIHPRQPMTVTARLARIFQLATAARRAA